MSGAAGGVLERRWLEAGYFDVRSRENRENTFTNQVARQLGEELGGSFRSIPYPASGARFKWAFYWREGDLPFAEAQFLASIDSEHAVLSIGISIERDPPGQSKCWKRLVSEWPGLVRGELPQLAEKLDRPLVVWGMRKGQESRTYVRTTRAWYRRREGPVDEGEAAGVVDELDASEDWVDFIIGYDLVLQDIPVSGGILPSDFATKLVAFDPIRRLLVPG